MRADARRNRGLLLSAALAAFTEHGADDVSLEEIARRAGVGIGTLYRHFPMPTPDCARAPSGPASRADQAFPTGRAGGSRRAC
jgi:Bacterial regulatory proteins, tetR family